MPSITEDLRRLDEYKAANPDLSGISDTELSKMINEQTGELPDLAKSSFVGRAVGKASNTLSDFGQGLEQTIVGDKTQASRPRRIVGKAANMVVQSAPEIAANYAASRVLPQSKTAAGLILAGNVGAAAARTEVETGDTKAAIGSGLGALTSSIGSIIGAKEGRRLATKGGLSPSLGGAAGGYFGSMPGDALEVGFQPGGFSEFLKDPDNLPAYLLSQAPFAAVDYMSERGNAAKMNREKSVAEIPTLDEFSQPKAEQQLVQLKKKPVATLTEQDLLRMEQLTAELQDKDRKRVRGQEVAQAQNIKQEYSGISYESPATLRSQLMMVNKGKKPVAFAEKGSTLPKMEVWEQQYVEHQRPEGTYFYNPDIVTPQAIDDAVKSDTLGQLLGYGVPSKPQNPNGLSYTLRDRKGNEKLSVELSYDTMTTVGAALKKLKEPTDRLVIEGTERVLAERKRAQQLIRDYSVRYEPDPYAGSSPDWQYIGQQPGYKHIPATELWNYVGQQDHPEFTRGSTYSRNSLEKAGIKLPPLATRLVGVDEATTTDKSRADYSLTYSPEQTLFMNPILEKMEKSFSQRVGASGRTKGPRFQRDASGLVSSKGMIEAVRQWAPKEMLDHYEQAGLSTLSKSDKVRPEEVAKWVQENTPDIEVKKLTPARDNNADKMSALQHRIDSLSEGHVAFVNRDGILVAVLGQSTPQYMRGTLYPLVDQYNAMASFPSYEQTDAATGRFGVEPIRVEEMDRPSDILVREPASRESRKGEGGSYDAEKGKFVKDNLKFHGPHFGLEDTNVLASVRGYFPTPDQYFAFEVQSDWGQRVAQSKQSAVPHPVSGRVNEQADRFLKEKNSPLLASYETLALKTAIKHALENGATRLVIPDAPTITMIEGHDNYAVPSGRGVSPSGIKQYAGMVQHYEKNLPSILKRLTGDSGRPVDLGKFTTREASSYFDGKDRITGREYDLTNLSPEVEKLFSIYGQADQYDYAASLVKAENELDAALLSGQDLTNEQFVNAIFQGKNVDKAVALNYLKNATGSLDTIKSYVMNGGPVDIAGVTTGKDIAVNVAKDPVKAFRTAAHELSHVATNELKYANPAAYNDLLSFFNDLTTVESRTRMFDQLAQASGLTEFDSKYQAGAMFDQADPNYRERVMKEGVAALSEVLAHEAYKSDARISPAVAKWLSFMPVGVQSFLSRLMNKLGTFFGPQYPSLRHMLSSEDRALLSKGFDKVVEFTRANQAAQDQAYKLLRRNGLIDEDTLLNRVQNRDDQSDWTAARQTLGGAEDEDVRDFALNFLTESRLATKARDTYEEYFFSPLFRAKIKPFTMDAFRELHHFRDKVKSFLNGYTEFLGQDKDKTRSREQAIAEQQKWIDRTVNNKVLNDKFNKVLTANLERREKAMAEGRTATGADLVSPEMMQSQYGLSQEESEYLNRLIETPKLVAEQTLRFMTATDTVNLAKMFFIQNRAQDIKEVKAKSAELTRVAGEAGAAAFQKRFYEEALQRMSADPSGNAQQIAEVQNRLMEIKVKTMQASQVFDAMTRQLFGQNFDMPGAPGEDFFINSMRDLAFKQAEVRAEQQFITKDEGYFPLVRRGRYLLRVFNEGPEDSIIKTTKEYKGFKTEKELREYVKKKKYRQEQIEVTDKEEIRNRVSLYSPKQVQALRDKTRADLQKTIDRLINSREFANEQIKTAVITNLQDVVNSYRPLEQELKDVVSVKGDKFRERRWLVPGYEENDFIPNLYEYMSYKTVSGQKTLTRAEVELQHLRPEIQSDPQLLQRMQQETDYVLSRTSEWKNARKFIFYSYLGASIKNALQNFLQLPLNAVPEAFAKGAGLHAYTDMIKAGGMSAKWLKDGTTGNKTYDVLLKQAETDGNVIPNLVEAYAPGADDVQNALDSVNKESNGFSWIGQKVDQAKSSTLSGLDRFMRSTSVASEAVNRRVSFLMSLQDSTRKGIKDPVQMYNNARDFTDFANFVGDKANRPGFQVALGKTWAHGPLLAATAMQSFVFNHISQLYAYRKQAKAGDVNAKKAFNAAMLHLVVFAGVLGIPLASTLEQLTEEATGFSAKNAARKKIIETATGLFDLSEEAGGRWADAVTTGLPTALGIDAGGSIGLGDPLLQYRAGEEVTGLDLLGPGGSLMQRWGQTLSSASKGDWNTASRQVPVKAWNHLTKIYDAVGSGDYKSQKGMPIVQNLGTGASVATVLGFTPRQVSIQRDMQNLRRKNDLKDSQRYQETVTQIARKLMDFQQSGDPSVQAEATELFEDYNKSTGYSQDRNDMIQSIVETMGRFRQPTTQPASAKSQQAYDAAASVFPEAKPHYVQQLPLLYEELETAQTLGQDDVLAKRMSSAQASAKRRALYDSLIQAGYSPAQASALSSGNTENLMRSLPSSSDQPAPERQAIP